jgi:hypothetical protein
MDAKNENRFDRVKYISNQIYDILLLESPDQAFSALIACVDTTLKELPEESQKNILKMAVEYLERGQ